MVYCEVTLATECSVTLQDGDVALGDGVLEVFHELGMVGGLAGSGKLLSDGGSIDLEQHEIELDEAVDVFAEGCGGEADGTLGDTRRPRREGEGDGVEDDDGTLRQGGPLLFQIVGDDAVALAEEIEDRLIVRIDDG